MYESGYGEDPMQDEGFEFSGETIRNIFISILMCQLIITLGMIILLRYHRPTRSWVTSHSELFCIIFALNIVLFICMACCTCNVRHKAPMNFIFLSTFPEAFLLSMAFLLSVVASTYESQEVMLAVRITSAVCLGLMIFAFQTIMILPGYTASCLSLCSFYLFLDTQMMIGGKRKHSISPEEYIFAALSLYLDVVNIFLDILTIIGATRD